ncbi:uncharacterized protein F4812DRAFT_263901 [Daldinia caldariorum]|uniref:uncharacterized protein n=1 Tax=Daldinia caldariorum TaxID=326644 RepID=UPI002008B2E1|nr:uncharacterized protein F4812DRAFT_263901 [Daldinia caldariorum]KAI1470407.1 hypothetical protein F4812DRAFT_263901 [Daldinia caldariorum]
MSTLIPRVPSNSTRGQWRGRGDRGRGRGDRGGTSSRSRGRGSWRGRGRGNDGREHGPNPSRSQDQPSRGIADDAPLGRLITKIALESNSNYNTGDAKITNCRYAASYSLVDSKTPKIIVPGEPATWTPPQLPSQLPGDRGDYLRDHNGARFPDHPMLPSVYSLVSLNKEFDTSKIDIMGCASSLGDILRFVRSVDLTFRFDVEMIGDTLFMVRNCRDQVIPDVRGYGHSFLDSFTSYESKVQETKSHQRIISYSFSGLNCLVRFECDGYLANGKDDFATTVTELDDLDLAESPAIETAGKIIPQQSIIEIKTRSKARSQTGAPVDMNEQLPRLWLRQIPYFITAYHLTGNFEDVQEKAIQQELLDWENSHQSELQRFASILRQLIVEVKRAGHLKLELCRTGSGPLELREQGGKPREVLPSDWRDMWARPHHGLGSDGAACLSDEDEDDSYPSLLSRKGESDESDDDDDDDFSLDFTGCDPSCGYCGKCA